MTESPAGPVAGVEIAWIGWDRSTILNSGHSGAV